MIVYDLNFVFVIRSLRSIFCILYFEKDGHILYFVFCMIYSLELAAGRSVPIKKASARETPEEKKKNEETKETRKRLRKEKRKKKWKGRRNVPEPPLSALSGKWVAAAWEDKVFRSSAAKDCFGSAGFGLISVVMRCRMYWYYGCDCAIYCDFGYLGSKRCC